MSLLLSMFCLGVYTLLAQMLVMRELAVACLGNELTIGVVFFVWMVLIGAGARMVAVGHVRPSGMLPLFLWLAAILPVVMLGLWMGAGWIRPPGEYVALHKVFVASFLALLPICVPAGMIFPLGCEALSRCGFKRAVSGVYSIEALGGFIAGVMFSFWLIGPFRLVQIVMFTSAIGFAGAAGVVEHSRGRRILVVITVGALLCGLSSSIGNRLEWRSMEMRWASLGVTHEGGDGRPAVTLKGGCDTRYQNLALLESGGQFSIYSDGQVMFSFPDDIACERAVNFIMAQKPDACRILLLGGNPAGELPHFLKFPVTEVVWVEHDPAIEDMIRGGMPGLYGALERDSRLKRVCEDGPRFVKRCGDAFDIVLVHAPEPVTGGLNRFYTREFYGDISRILAPGGFMHTSIEASERLETDASRMAGSIYRTLRAVFPVVRVTAGSPLHFFASGIGGTLSLDPEVLCRRSSSTHVARSTFRPEYFLDADELVPEKIVFTEHRLTKWDAPENTMRRPVSCYYSLILWSQYSHSLLEPLFRRMALWRAGRVMGGMGGLGLLLMVIAVIVRLKRPAGLPYLATSQAMAVTGFGGVALELILLYAFQGIHGYVYSRMGFMVGLFMLGAVAGAWQIRNLESAGYDVVWRSVVLCLLLMVTLACVVPLCLMNRDGSEWMLYGLTLATGGVVAMQFVAVSRLFILSGAAPGAAAGRVWLADYWGSALGGLLVGVFLMPVLGIGFTCHLVAIIFGISLTLFAILMPRRRE
jgi:spermidine synthase